MKEVELKCWITPENEKRIQKFLNSRCSFIGEKYKKDTNFCFSGLKEEEKKIEFRLREEVFEDEEMKFKKFFVTQKIKTLSKNGVELNDELEFEVSDGEAFKEFILTQGFEVFFLKEKKVEQYEELKNLDENLSILFEKLEIPQLGKFLEVEIICEERFLEKAEQKIFSFFQQLDLEKDIEKSPYMVLLRKS